MEVCTGLKLITVQNEAALGDGSFQIGEGLEVPIGERLIEDRPEVLSGLKLGGVWGQVDEPEALLHHQVRRGVPAGVIELKHDDALASAPASRANNARSAAKNGLEMPFDTYQKVSPEIGCTKAVT